MSRLRKLSQICFEGKYLGFKSHFESRFWIRQTEWFKIYPSTQQWCAHSEQMKKPHEQDYTFVSCPSSNRGFLDPRIISEFQSRTIILRVYSIWSVKYIKSFCIDKMVNKAQHGTSYLNVYYQKIKIHVDTVKYVKVKQ